jgi:Zn-dependent protease
LDILNLAIILPPILLALTVHEYAHGYVAYRLGDDTAYLAGRLTLNPLSHLDPIGTLMLILVHIGWAKPVPVNPYNLNNPRRDIILVSIAGPGANILLAFISGLIFRLTAGGSFFHSISVGGILLTMIAYSVLINLVLAFFNLIPIPPLDGSRVVSGLLRGEAYNMYAQLERFGPILFLVLVGFGYLFHLPILWWIISPFVSFFSVLFTGMDLSGF